MKPIFGNENKYPTLKSIRLIISELEGRQRNKILRYMGNTISELHIKYSELNCVELDRRAYFYDMVRKDFIERVNYSTLSEKLKDHLKNYIVAHNREAKRKLGIR